MTIPPSGFGNVSAPNFETTHASTLASAKRGSCRPMAPPGRLGARGSGVHLRYLRAMATSYDEAVAALYRAPHGEFVTERKRLAADLKAAGDKAGATRLGKLPRPPISAWAVNQLWWQEQAAFETLFSTAKKVREGDRGAIGEHRDAAVALRGRAQAILVEAGHAAAEATLRRVGSTLAGLAATGSFDPDPPGALGDDRDPPGFEALGGLVGQAPAARTEPAATKDTKDTNDDEAEERHRAAEAAREARRQEEARREREAAVRVTERALGAAKAERDAKQLELDRLRKAVVTAERALADAEERIPELEAELTERRGALDAVPR